MKNKAKCKLCEEIIESVFFKDDVNCKCGEISLSGGNIKNWCYAKNWENFLRIDDDGNEIVPRIINASEKNEVGDEYQKISKPTKEEKIEMLGAMIKSTKELPEGAMILPISQYDFLSLIMLLYSIFKDED